MKRLLFAATAVLAFTSAASADTISGSWSNATISAATSPNTFLFFDTALPTNGTFTVNTAATVGGVNNGRQPESTFLTVSPGGCTGSGCNAATANVSVTFGQIKDGTSVISNGFTLNGIYEANFHDQTDDVKWTGVTGLGGGATASVFGPGGISGVSFIPMADGTGAPGGIDLSFAFGSETVNLYVLDGADWNVVTDISATAVAAVPEPSTWAMMILGFAGIVVMGAKRRREGGAAFRLV